MLHLLGLQRVVIRTYGTRKWQITEIERLVRI
jgi:hypothetical protein